MSELTGAFYRMVGASFSATRAAGWPGWERVLDRISDLGERPRVLDLACGNLRFERTLFSYVPRAEVWAVDSCDALAADDDPRIRYRHRDLAALLMREGATAAALDAPVCDAALCLAFMHHLPLFEQRARLMETLVGAVRAGGVVAVSFWQFAHDARLLAKAQAATQVARERFDLSGLGADDYLMGWQDETDAFRFCHHCADDEIDALAGTVAAHARVVARYAADGASGSLNQYVILENRS